MGRKLQYTTLDRVISKLYRDLGLEEISETDIIEWSAEALEFIGAVALYEEAVSFIEVENYQADLPNGLHSVIQVAKNNKWCKEDKSTCPANVILDCTTEQMLDSTSPHCGCNEEPVECPIITDCQGKIIGDYEIAYYRPYFDLQYEFYGWSHSNYYKQEYTPVKLANHTFFNSIVCEEDPVLYRNCTDEYTIVENKIRTSFKDGYIAVSYYRQKVDPETGYPMIPDEISVITAITMYVTMKYMARLWYMGREGYADKYQKAEQDWQWYCKQAGNKQMMLYGVDQHQNFTESKFQLIPKLNRYYGYFGKLGRQEGSGINLRGI